ncbi:MAG: hypothetical protein HYY52_04625 [Candidatus Melainabacteria bacterium]|nr:hypothetical protein [Candidatus Melainabacteria bacterium]
MSRTKWKISSRGRVTLPLLKDTLESLNKNLSFDKNTENPFYKLAFKENKVKKNNLWLMFLIISLISVSIFFNSFFLKKLDPLIINTVTTSVSLLKEFYRGLFDKSYVLTIGKYGDLLIAKEEAIKLLPQFKQINIKQLNTGIYVFEVERFGSKKKAYLTANKFIQDGFEEVHVRYLPNLPSQ